jgi:hypothetical protein
MRPPRDELRDSFNHISVGSRAHRRQSAAPSSRTRGLERILVVRNHAAHAAAIVPHDKVPLPARIPPAIPEDPTRTLSWSSPSGRDR